MAIFFHLGLCTITFSDLNRPCFAWHPYGKLRLFKTELVVVMLPKSYPLVLLIEYYISIIGWSSNKHIRSKETREV